MSRVPAQPPTLGETAYASSEREELAIECIATGSYVVRNTQSGDPESVYARVDRVGDDIYLVNRYDNVSMHASWGDLFQHGILL
ncbi:MAG: hypothetical protein NVV66_18510 [Cellulomonas sp.]|uniref:hypothetical protein n=1 Tax=Cellulomonas sp. TaxID=40001 RepID=UPI002589DF5E|nr:hypothetical protein [Cellulomonas sp.]MCR6706590.1 hypothetical protein [Cellulomonas sp.]